MDSGATTQLPNDTKQDTKQTKLVDVVVSNPNEALQLIATFLNLAQKRGAFSLDESAKIWECIKLFQDTNEYKSN